MEKNGEKGKGVTGEKGDSSSSRFPSFPLPLLPRRRQSGFTLLELMIVISIIVILAMIVLPQYQKAVVQAREAALRDDLFQMRKLLDQYAADKGRLPQTLDDLASSGYLRDVPVDPMTGNKDWLTVAGEDPNSTEGGSGIVDVCSSSPDISSDGTPYNDCTKW